LEKLTPKQRAHLKSLAHPLRPILHVGKEGATHAVLQTVGDAFHNRELIKVKVLESAPAGARELAEAFATVEGVHVVQVIGRTVVLYRRHPENPEIVLPR
jgi:RNA-binding protein